MVNTENDICIYNKEIYMKIHYIWCFMKIDFTTLWITLKHPDDKYGISGIYVIVKVW